MIGNTTFDELLDCHKVIGKETALNLLSNSSTEFLGIELFSPNFIKNTDGKDLLEFSVPIHFNYQHAVLDDRKYIKIHLYPILSFIHYSSNQSLSVSSDSSFPEINRLFQRSNLGNERPLANTYYQQLTDSIQNGSYQFLGVSPFCTDQATVLIPVGNVSDYVWVAPVTSLVTIACLLALIIKVIVMIRESILIIHQKVAAEKKSE
jgi:heme exporter protein D